MQKIRMLVVSGFLVFAVVIASRQNEGNSAGDVLETARQAAGGDAWSRVAEIVTDGKLQAGSNKGSLYYVEDVAAGRSVLHYEFSARSSGTQGTDVHGSWHQDAKGYMSISDGTISERDAADERYLTQRAYWQPDFGGAAVALLPPNDAEQSRYDRVEVKPKGGGGFVLWINRQSRSQPCMEGAAGGGHRVPTFSPSRSSDQLPAS
jgi:hypothetical protein